MFNLSMFNNFIGSNMKIKKNDNTISIVLVHTLIPRTGQFVVVFVIFEFSR